MYITDRDLPCWYRLRSDGTGITVSVHPDVVEQVLRDIDPDPYLDTNPEPYGLSGYQPPRRDGPWGFGGVLVPVQGGWPGWRCRFPNLRDLQPHTDFHRLSWKPLYNIATSLELLFEALRTTAYSHVQSDQRQLVLVRTFHPGWDFQATFNVELSPLAVRWIKARNGYLRLPVQEVMWQAWKSIYRYHRSVERSMFKVEVQEEFRLFLAVPEEPASLNAEWETPIGRGYEMNDHNIDTPAEQLELLAGIAQVDELIHLAA